MNNFWCLCHPRIECKVAEKISEHLIYFIIYHLNLQKNGDPKNDEKKKKSFKLLSVLAPSGPAAPVVAEFHTKFDTQKSWRTQKINMLGYRAL